MARDARWIAAVILHALLEGHLENCRIGQINLRHGRRRWRRRIVQQVFQQPNAALERVRIFAVRIHHQQSRGGEQAATQDPGRQYHLTELIAVHLRHAVMPCQPIVHQHVIGMEKLRNRSIGPQHLGKERDRFLLHRLQQKRIDLAVRLGINLHEIQLLHAQPLPRVMPGKPCGARIGQQPSRLLFQHVGVG